MSVLPQESLKQLKFFISHLKSHPDLIHTPDLSFFKEYLEHLGATVPPPAAKPQPKPKPEPSPAEHTPPPPKKEEPPKPQPPPKAEEKVEEMETDVPEPEPAEPEDPHLWAPDVDYESLPLGDNNKQASEEDMEKANDLLSEARGAAREQNYSEAVAKLTHAIQLNPAQSNLFAFRAEYLVAQKKPNAAIRDTNRALELNPDSSRALKTRGKAKRYLGKYLEAFYDLSQGNSLDWDESTPELIKDISERAERAKQKQRKEEEKHRLEQLKRDAAEKRRRQQQHQEEEEREQQEGGAGFEGLNDLFSHLKDPEIQNLFKSNPALIQKVMKALSGDMAAAQDPDVQKVITKLQSSFAGAAPTGHEGHSHAGHEEHSHAGHEGHSHGPGGHTHSHSKPSDDDDLD